ncbi:hypothetical protein [Mordavella massiliensis]|uniref:hypothetical protein n=1 Tax=Mordavella massiliensis TaxID=1871024 RepID=UPI00210972CA|nr:hypothetical protein [Mordavella massiliensis]
MATFSKELSLKYQELDYSGVIGNYNWIKDILSSLFENIEKPDCEISFHMGDISCSCQSIKEFSEHAYGQTINVYVYDLTFYQNSSDNNRSRVAHIIITSSDKSLTIYCDSKEILIKICTALEDSMKPEISNVLLQAENIQYIHDESTHVTMGDRGTIQSANIGKNNMIKTETPTPKESFWKPVLQTLAANWVWFILGIILIVALGYLGIKNTDWMNVF